MKNKNKFGAKHIEKAGLWFDSKAESKHHDEMLLRERAGEIIIQKLQDRIHLVAGIHWVVDFKIMDMKANAEVWEEFKGFSTPEFILKKKLWSVFGPGILRIYYATGKIEIVTPKGSK